MVRVNTRISKKLNDWLDEYSQESGLPQCTLIHLALENYVNPTMMLEQIPKMPQMFSTMIEMQQQLNRNGNMIDLK
ncbi:hypothetical protein [Bacillus cereus]|uniref:hypothetical protein n=1 Tax=Bacillus cereus TaxID=1396 RepID=UPI0028529AE4|nr:hypothetical protein [Bacillus cereus]